MSNDKTVANCLLFMTSILVFVLLAYLKAIFIPFTIAIFLYFIFTPFIDLMVGKWDFSARLATYLIILSLILFCVASSLLMVDFFKNLVEYILNYKEYLLDLANKLQDLGIKYGYQIDLDFLSKNVIHTPLVEWTTYLSKGIMKFFSSSILVLVFVMFLLIGNISEQKNQHTKKIGEEISTKISRYLATKLFTSFLTGLLVGFVLWLIGNPLFVLFGLASFFLNFIPSIGSMIAVLLPIPVVFLQSGIGLDMLLTILLPGLIQFSIGNILDPKLMGQSLGLHVITILMSLLIWGTIWGVVGMFLSVPITSIIKLILEKFPHSRHIGKLLEGEISQYLPRQS